MNIDIKIKHYPISSSGVKGVTVVIPKPTNINLIKTLDYYSSRDNSHENSYLLYKSGGFPYKRTFELPEEGYIFFENIYKNPATKGILKCLKQTIELINEEPESSHRYYLDDLLTHLKALRYYATYD